MNYLIRIKVGLLFVATSAGLQAAETTAGLTDGRLTLDLSGSRWQMEGIRPGQGLEEGFHEHFGEVCPSTYNWNGARVPGDVYTDLWRAGEIDDPHYGRNGLRAKWVMEKEWWYQPLLISLECDKRRWLPGETFTSNLWIVNDLHQVFTDCTLKVTISDHQGHQLATESYPVEKVLPDSSAQCGTFEWPVRGRLGETFRIDAALQNAQSQLLSANHHVIKVKYMKKRASLHILVAVIVLATTAGPAFGILRFQSRSRSHARCGFQPALALAGEGGRGRASQRTQE